MAQAFVCTQAKLTQASLVQSLASSQSPGRAGSHSTQPPPAIEQRPMGQFESCSEKTHVPPWQLSSVQSIPSLQSPLPQHSAQPLEQHCSFPLQNAKLHVPVDESQLQVLQGSPSSQSLGPVHCAALTHPCTGSHTCPGAQRPSSGGFEQVPLLHESIVQSTPSLQSSAAQHWPHCPLGQHVESGHRAGFEQLPAGPQTSMVHGSPSLQFDFEQHSRHPTPGQQSVPPSQ